MGFTGTTYLNVYFMLCFFTSDAHLEQFLHLTCKFFCGKRTVTVAISLLGAIFLD